METELRAGVQPLEELLDEHRHVRRKVVALWAKYGPGGVAEHLRKAELARIVEYLRAMATAEERKTTEAALDAAAHSHKQYLDFIAEMTRERAEYFELNAQLQEVEWKVNRGQAMIRYSTVELQGAGT
jgi:FMN phosphatase YigB (HAD superfamily)